MKAEIKNKNLIYSIYDGIAYSVMVSFAENYFTAFALFFKLTSNQIAMLLSIP